VRRAWEEQGGRALASGRRRFEAWAFRAARGEAMGNKFSGERLRSILLSPQRQRRQQRLAQHSEHSERCDTETEQDLENYVAQLQTLDYLSPRKSGQRVRAVSAGRLDSEELDLPEHLRLQ
jgi:hypothetical protein